MDKVIQSGSRDKVKSVYISNRIKEKVRSSVLSLTERLLKENEEYLASRNKEEIPNESNK